MSLGRSLDRWRGGYRGVPGPSGPQNRVSSGKAPHGYPVKMAARLGDQVDRRRQQGFVGRRAELRAFETALADASAARIFLVHGPGGIGKTTLLMEMRARAQAAGRAVTLLDGNEIDPS